MKHINTIGLFSFLFLTLFISNGSFSQSVFNVDVANFQFTPNALTIDVGDTVRWTNISGTHNVNGTTATFPSNPVAFSNPNDGSGSWVFDVVFAIAGTYQYQCGVHGSGMSGTITVNSSSLISENEIKAVLIYPNPTQASFFIEYQEGIKSIEIYDLKGQQVYKLNGDSQSLIIIDCHHLRAGSYTYIIHDINGKLLHGKIAINY